MKIGLLLIVILCTIKANAQDYLINFTGTGASSTLNNVEVENLATGASVTLIENEVLNLKATVGISDVKNDESKGIVIYPNPMTEKSTLLISAPDEGDAIISVCDITGKMVIQIKTYLEKYPQEFTISGLNNGIYIINVKGITFRLSGRLISNGKSNGMISLVKIRDNMAIEKKRFEMDSKGIQATINMEYTIGDRLKFKGSSGIYSTVKTDIPTEDKTITFDFIKCSDGDNNNYTVVEIDTQTWMAENLKTTKYNDGTTIPLVTVNTDWAELSTPGFCWYDNDLASYKDYYGALYNWYAVDGASNGGKNLCPSGWHVPTKDDWATLVTFLEGESYAGSKLKEAGITNWISPNTEATNETGFTALPGGFRYHYGAFNKIGSSGCWWSSIGDGSTAFSLNLYSSSEIAFSYTYFYRYGYSVRCLKDN